MSTTDHRALRLHVGGVGALMLITGVAYLMGVRPLLAARVEAWELDRTLSEKREMVDDLRRELASTKSDLETARKTLESGEIALVPSNLVNAQLAKIGIAADESGVTITETAPGQLEVGTLVERTPIRISGKGYYPDFARFLTVIDRDLNDTVVLGFTIAGRADVPGEPATFSVDLLWYALNARADSAASEGSSVRSSQPGG